VLVLDASTVSGNRFGDDVASANPAYQHRVDRGRRLVRSSMIHSSMSTGCA
jgi:hypothetical protein